MEYFDILDEEGNFTGVKKSREESHQQGHLHASVLIWIYNSKGEILIQRRSQNKDAYAGMWDGSHGGHVCVGDNITTTVIKELDEELGITVSPKDFKFIKRSRFQDKSPENNWYDNEFNYIYLLKHDGSIEDMVLQEEELDEVALISTDTLEAHIADPIKRKEYCPHGDYSCYTDLIKHIREEF